MGWDKILGPCKSCMAESESFFFLHQYLWQASLCDSCQKDVSFFWSSPPHCLWNLEEFSCLFLQDLVHRFPRFPNGLRTPSLFKCFLILEILDFKGELWKLHFLGMPLNLSKVYNHLFSRVISLCWQVVDFVVDQPRIDVSDSWQITFVLQWHF